jgi:hypothetical protein
MQEDMHLGAELHFRDFLFHTNTNPDNLAGP